VTKIQIVIDVTVETLRPVIPGTSADENTARKPLRTVIAVGCTVVRWDFVVPVWTDRRTTDSDTYRNMRPTASGEKDGNHAAQNCNPQQAVHTKSVSKKSARL